MTDYLKSSKTATIDIERAWENIGISNDFLFGKLMRQYPGLCKKLLQRSLPGLAIDHIDIVWTK